MKPIATPAVRRAIGLVLVGVVLAVACGLLGRWQWNRHVARNAVIAQIDANFDAAPVPLGQLLPSPAAAFATTDVWRPVTVVGRYDPAHTALLRNRPITGRAGFHALVPFMVTSPTGAPTVAGAGRPAVIVVDRGWLPAGERDRPDTVTAPPAGTVQITVRLRADEPASRRDAPARQVQAISVDQVLTAGGIDPATVGAYSAYGALAAERPAPPRAIGALPKPSTDPGSHLSYAFQWWTFALGALIGFGRLGWLELHEQEPRTGRAARPGFPGRSRGSRGPSAEEEEDALIDSQLG